MSSHRPAKRESGTPEGALNLIRRHLGPAVIGVFRAENIDAVPASKETSPRTGEIVVALIDFAGAHMRGTLMLTAELSSVENWRAPFDVDSATEVCDILGEVANLVLGRLKGRLLAEGLPISMSTPMAVRGPVVCEAPGRPEEHAVCVGSGWRLSAHVDATFDDDFGLEEEPSAMAAQAGDVLLF